MPYERSGIDKPDVQKDKMKHMYYTKFSRETTTVPNIYALYRARKYLDSIHSDILLVITGGLHVSSELAKAIIPCYKV